jgi:glycosyltransferase involved in cell wall biosynthesis
MPLLSIVIPMYNEEAVIEQCFNTLKPILDAVDQDWEIICVDDGSRDDSVKIVRRLADADARIKLLEFSRNFGKEAALTAGLDATTGDAVIPLDADLQDPPELIPQMVEKWREGWKVVLAVRAQRSGDSAAKRITAGWFYNIMSRISSVSIPRNAGDFRLMDRQVVEAVKQLPERTRFMKGILAWVGFETTQVTYDRPERSAGETKFAFRSLWKLALDGIFSFTTLPLKIWTYLGAVISLLAFAYAIVLIVRTMLFGTDVPGYASLMVMILFMGGIQLISLGVIGEYVGRIFRETKQRPLYIVKQKTGF